jgi:hypothetical protein
LPEPTNPGHRRKTRPWRRARTQHENQPAATEEIRWTKNGSLRIDVDRRTDSPVKQKNKTKNEREHQPGELDSLLMLTEDQKLNQAHGLSAHAGAVSRLARAKIEGQKNNLRGRGKITREWKPDLRSERRKSQVHNENEQYKTRCKYKFFCLNPNKIYI